MTTGWLFSVAVATVLDDMAGSEGQISRHRYAVALWLLSSLLVLLSF